MAKKKAEITGNKDLYMSGMIVGILSLLILNLPPIVLDALLGINVTIAAMILLGVVYMISPTEMSAFPSMLLIATLFRLGLNIASTKLILLNGEQGTGAAGNVIKTFGEFVVGGNYVVGVIVFLVLVIINFMVITKGSGRIAEVAARFTLEALPGKQMAIDADLQAGNIDEEEARERRKEIKKEAEFYGSMDGASKFVSGDALAGLIITGINIVAGIIIGIAQKDMEAVDALQTYTILTIGDGLVAQIPALLISVSAGILVTRATGEKDMGDEILSQIAGHHRSLYSVSVFLIMFGLLPGMPFMIFLTIAGFLSYVAYNKQKQLETEKETQELEEAGLDVDGAQTLSQNVEELLPLDVIELEVGYALIPLVDKKHGGEMLERILQIRRQFAAELGIIVPQIHIRDNLQLEANEYVIKVKGAEIAKGDLMVERYLAINPGDIGEEIAGIDTIEPTFGMPAKWVDENEKAKADTLGFTVVDCPTVLSTHITESIRAHASDLIDRQEAHELIEIFKQSNPKTVEELIPSQMSIGDVLKVFKNLLREKISIRDLRTILGSLADFIPMTKNTEILTELVRQRLYRQISAQHKGFDQTVYVINLDPVFEDHLRGTLNSMDDVVQIGASPDDVEGLITQIEQLSEGFFQTNSNPILICSPELRRPLFYLLDRFFPQLNILSTKELEPKLQVESIGTIAMNQAA